jgi:hypothetical protein
MFLFARLNMSNMLLMILFGGLYKHYFSCGKPKNSLNTLWRKGDTYKVDSETIVSQNSSCSKQFITQQMCCIIISLIYFKMKLILFLIFL